MKIYISAMAETRTEIERALNGATYQVIENIFKLLLLPNHAAVNHWRKEIASSIYEVGKLKSTKRFPTAEQLYAWTYKKKQDLVTDVTWVSRLINNICYEYDVKNNFVPFEISNQIDSICELYFSWLSSELAAYGYVEFKMIYSKLDDLLFD